MNENLPQAYKIGYQDFYGRDFIVTPDVLIPRPETEQIIDTVLNLAGKPYLKGVKPSKNQLPENPVILDVGTGSGCIAITLKLELPNAKVYASDISEKALNVARKNTERHGVTIPLIISYLLEKVNNKEVSTPDIIVANLPYVDKNWDWLDKTALSHEPSIALYAKDHGLVLIKELINEASNNHIPRLILEADPSQHQTIINYAQNKYNLEETRGFVLSLKNSAI